MVAVSIGLLMTGVGVVYINDFNSKQKLNSTKAELVAVLREARSYAKTRQQTSAAVANYLFVGVVVNPAGLIEVGVNCESSGCAAPFFSPKKVAVDSSVNISSAGGVVRFASYDTRLLSGCAGTVCTPSGVGVTFTITSVETGKTETVVVTSLGQINE